MNKTSFKKCNGKSSAEIEEIIKSTFPDFPIDLLILIAEYVNTCFVEEFTSSSNKEEDIIF